MAKKLKGVKRPSVKSKSPGAAPKSARWERIDNLKEYAHKAKGLPKGTKIGAAKSVANQIRKSVKKGRSYE